jgi:hypothetical protein
MVDDARGQHPSSGRGWRSDDPIEEPGHRVVVRSRFNASWSSGFEVEALVERSDGQLAYRLRRLSDRAVLPGLFAAEDVLPDGP